MIRATLDHLDQGVAVFDALGRLAGWNQRLSVLLTLPLSRLRRGMAFDQLLAQMAGEMRLQAPMEAGALRTWASAGPGRAPLVFQAERLGGLILTVFAQELPDGGFVMSFTDVTAERTALAALHRANETLEARVRERTLELEDALADAERPTPAGRGSSRRPAMTSCNPLRRPSFSSLRPPRARGRARWTRR